ncbi:nose resistant to fluoxetine protein 6-like [Oscarella lobularis]|uniref:nose resistant to fluoxetine protein 6-like n=1 Tax=Oscarella lobularis TaxID=121494 RepID=UPI0033134DBF
MAFVLFALFSIVSVAQGYTPAASDAFRRFISSDQRSYPTKEAFDSLFLNLAKNVTPPLPHIGPDITRMIDATGKPGSGILTGNTQFLGDFDECESLGSDVSKYCLFSAALDAKPTPKNETTLLSNFSIPLFRWGLCINHTTNETLLNMTLFTELNRNFTPTSIEFICYKEKSLSNGAIVTIVFFSLLGLVVLISTLYDIIHVHMSERSIQRLNGSSPGFVAPSTKSVNIVTSGSTTKSDDSDVTNLLSSIGSLKPARGTSRLMALLNAFSLARNLPKLLDTQVQAKSIQCLHGIRTLSMFWVILGHSYVWFGYVFNVANPLMTANFTKQFAFQGVSSAFLSVDTFFFISGLLVMYLLYQRLESNLGHFPWFNFYFHRVWRLTPTYFVALVILWTLLLNTNDGPFWDRNVPKLTSPCNDYWWTNMLYINNFYPTDFYGQCMGWAWYLACDMQMYVLTPFIIYPAYRYGVAGLLVPLTLCLAGVYITLISLSVVYHFPPNAMLGGTNEAGSVSNEYTEMVYKRFYTRAAPYLIGLLFGYILARRNQFSKGTFLKWVLQRKRFLVPIAWGVAFALGLTVVYGLYKYNNFDQQQIDSFPQTLSVLYVTFQTSLWAIALSILIFLCCTGHGGLINSILSWGGWIPLSRLTYSAYLLHPLVLSYISFSSREVLFISHPIVVFRFVATIGLSYLFAALLSLCIEYPSAAIEKVFSKTVKV